MVVPSGADSIRQRLWVISEMYYPEETSTGAVLTGLAEGLAHIYEVHVLCAQPTYNARGTHAPSYERRHGTVIRRCPATTLNKDNLLFRLINLITISVSIFILALWYLRRGDHVLVVTNPPLLPFLVTIAARLRGAKILLLIHDVYPEVLITTGLLSPQGLPARIINQFNQQLYKSVDRIIVLGRDMAELVRRKCKAAGSKVEIIPNWAQDLERIAPGNCKCQNSLLQELKLTHKFVIQYSGNMGRTHGLETLLEAAKQLSDFPEVHFLLIGSGAKKRWLEEAMRQSDLRNITLLPYQPRAALAVSLNACDLAIISFVPDMAGISVPSRMYNIMAAGKPILAVADADSELALVLQEEEIGWVVPPDEPARIVEVILSAHAQLSQVQEMGARARTVAENKYSRPVIIERYIRAISSLDNN